MAALPGASLYSAALVGTAAGVLLPLGLLFASAETLVFVSSFVAAGFEYVPKCVEFCPGNNDLSVMKEPSALWGLALSCFTVIGCS